MANQRTLNIINIFAIICGIWFVAFGWVWAWLANVIFVFPFAILGLILWLVGRKAEKKILSKVAGWLLVAGTVLSVGTLLAWIISEKL